MTSGIPFRAGRQPGEQRELAAAHPDLSTGAAVLMADISEFEPSISDAAYLAWSKAIIIRAAYGANHDDHAWYGGARRADLLAGGARFLGIYQYITAFEDVTAQARVFCGMLGTLNKGEYLIADIEEGSGSQQARWQTWANVVNGELGFAPGDYSGYYFAQTAGLAPVDWVAAYQSTEPSVPHLAWQFTDAYNVPGVGSADCSIFHGTIDQLSAYAFLGQPQPTPVKDDDLVMPVLDLTAGGPAVVLPVPAGATKLALHADIYRATTAPVIRTGLGPVWSEHDLAPLWGAPAVIALPAGTVEVTLARKDAGDVPVTAMFS